MCVEFLLIALGRGEKSQTIYIFITAFFYDSFVFWINFIHLIYRA